jgi:hypothetical protein
MLTTAILFLEAPAATNGARPTTPVTTNGAAKIIVATKCAASAGNRTRSQGRADTGSVETTIHATTNERANQLGDHDLARTLANTLKTRAAQVPVKRQSPVNQIIAAHSGH